MLEFRDRTRIENRMVSNWKKKKTIYTHTANFFIFCAVISIILARILLPRTAKMTMYNWDSSQWTWLQEFAQQPNGWPIRFAGICILLSYSLLFLGIVLHVFDHYYRWARRKELD